MPLFEYRCTACGESREVLARSAEAAEPPRCEACGVAMGRQLAAVAAHTRGGVRGCTAPRGGFS